MSEYLGVSGLLPPDDADIRNELTCAGREASLGFDAMVGLYGSVQTDLRASILTMRTRSSWAEGGSRG
jgi:hypothetical protein